jgi:hypothetical protein
MVFIILLGFAAYLSKDYIHPTLFVGVGVLFLLLDTWLFSKGYDTYFWRHTTPNELEIQKKKAGLK